MKSCFQEKVSSMFFEVNLWEVFADSIPKRNLNFWWEYKQYVHSIFSLYEVGIGCSVNFCLFLQANNDTVLKVWDLNLLSKIGFFVPDLIHTCSTDGTSVEVDELPKIPSTHSSKRWLTTSLHQRKSSIDNCLHDINNPSHRRHFEKYKSLVIITPIRKAASLPRWPRLRWRRVGLRAEAKRQSVPRALPRRLLFQASEEDQ